MSHAVEKDLTKEKTKPSDPIPDAVRQDDQWHSGAYAELRIDLTADQEILDYHEEYQLTQQALRIDMLVRKHPGGIPHKSLTKLFRGHNIIEYKNPLDSFGVNDMHKVFAYAAVYQSRTAHEREIDPNDITITILCNRFPREAVKFLKEERGMTVEKKYRGIYYVHRFLFPMQIVIIHELSPEEYPWLSRLRKDLTAKDLVTLLKECEGHEKDPRYQLALDVIMKANTEKSREVKSMNIPAFYEIFADDLQKEREEGRKEGHEEGREEGRKEATREITAKAIGNLMDSLKMSADAAMDILKISETERSFYQAML